MSICKWKILIKRSDFTFWPFLVFDKARHYCRERSWHFDILLFLIFTYAWFLLGSLTLTWNAFTCSRLYYAEGAHGNNSHSMATILTHLVAFSRFLVMTSLSRKKNPREFAETRCLIYDPTWWFFSYNFRSIDSEFSYMTESKIIFSLESSY